MTRRIPFALFLLTMVAGLAVRGAEPAGNAIVMSPYEISAQGAEFKNWIRITAPHFVLYTDASLKEGTKVVRELEMGHFAAQYIFRRKLMRRAPLTIILPTAGSDWRKLEARGSVKWHAAVADTADRVGTLVTVLYDWQENGISILRSVAGTDALDALNVNLPFTIARGVGTFFETAVIEKNTITLGRQSRRTAALSTGWLPWDRFFAAGPGSKEYQDEVMIHQLDGQGASFVQYILTNTEPAWLDRMMQWASWLNARNPVTEAQFVRVFGQDWKSWQKTMDAFRQGGRAMLTTLNLPPAFAEFLPTADTPPVAEMRELFVLAQILNQHIPASEAALDTLLNRGLKSNSLRGILATACLQWKRPARLLIELEEMIKAESQNPDVYSLAAELYLDRIADPVQLTTRLDATAVEALRGWCHQALELEPALTKPTSCSPGPRRWPKNPSRPTTLPSKASTNACTAKHPPTTSSRPSVWPAGATATPMARGRSPRPFATALSAANWPAASQIN